MSKIRFTEPNREILARRDSIINDLTRLVDPAGLITSTDECRAYETDALTAYRKMPLAVVLPRATEEVSAVLKYCHDTGVKVVPRQRRYVSPAGQFRVKTPSFSDFQR